MHQDAHRVVVEGTAEEPGVRLAQARDALKLAATGIDNHPALNHLGQIELHGCAPLWNRAFYATVSIGPGVPLRGRAIIRWGKKWGKNAGNKKGARL